MQKIFHTTIDKKKKKKKQTKHHYAYPNIIHILSYEKVQHVASEIKHYCHIYLEVISTTDDSAAKG